MQWRRNAPLLIAGSILALVLSLYGIFGELSIVVGMGALGALLVGVIILAATHLREGVVIPHWGVLAVAAAGFLLHMYEGAPGIGYLLGNVALCTLCRHFIVSDDTTGGTWWRIGDTDFRWGDALRSIYIESLHGGAGPFMDSGMEHTNLCAGGNSGHVAASAAAR